MTMEFGVFVLVTKTNKGFEYRVKLAEVDDGFIGHYDQKTKKWKYNADTIKRVFGNAPIYNNKELAEKAALKISNDRENITFLEWGIYFIDRWNDMKYADII